MGHRASGSAIIVDASGKRGKAWRENVAATAVAQYRKPPMTGALIITAAFYLPRPDSHYVKSHTREGKRLAIREIRDKAPRHHTIRPDATKLWRSTEDALTGIAWEDDAQIVRQSVEKRYGEEPGVYIEIRRTTP